MARRLLRLLVVAVSTAATLLVPTVVAENARHSAPTAPAPLQSTHRSQGLRTETFAHFERRLEKAARAHRSLGYFDPYVHKRIDLGFVGPMPQDVRDVIHQAPPDADIRVARSIFTLRQLNRAEDKAFSNRTYRVAAAWHLDRGRGLGILTESRTLANSYRPSWLLGVRVGVIARFGSVSPA